MFAKWIKCTQKHAAEGIRTHRNVERACDIGKVIFITQKLRKLEGVAKFTYLQLFVVTYSSQKN